MPGVSLGITLPTVGVTAGPTYATQINTAIQTIIDDVEAKIVPGEINFNADVDINSQVILDIDSMKLDTQTAALSGAGNARRVNSAGGELWWCDGSGVAVKITESGGLNVAGAGGGFTGDFGNSNEAVTYTASTNTYAFTDDATSPAIIDVKEVHHQEYVELYHPSIADASLGTWALGTGAITSTTDADELHVPIRARVGDRIKQIEFHLYITGDGQASLYLDRQWDGSNTNIVNSTGLTQGVWGEKTLASINHTVIADAFYDCRILYTRPSSGTFYFGGLRVTYDRT
jgi:hypothetical protein